MRKSLRDAVHSAVAIEIVLPYKDEKIEIDKSCLSSMRDICLKHSNPEDVSRVIYNGIVEYAENQYRIDYGNLSKEQTRIIISKLRYNQNADPKTKEKYGFFGEVLLDLILRTYLSTKVLVARGYFYSPIERGEARGFDAFHLLESKIGLELWFGEAKFYLNFKSALTSVIKKLKQSISNGYLSNNLLAIFDRWQDATTKSPQVQEILDEWNNNPSIDLASCINEKGISLVYPVFIAYQKPESTKYHDSIADCINCILHESQKHDINIEAAFNYKIFFILLPLHEVTKLKQKVIEWIDSKEPLI